MNKTINIAFFDTKPYDREFFDQANRDFGYNIKYYPSRLSKDTVLLAGGADVLCAFVNDNLDSEIIDQLVKQGTKLIALRCAGYNNVDLRSVFGKIHVVRVPAYSPYAVAEHAVALILSLNRNIHRAYNRTRDNNFTITGFLGFDLQGKTAGVIGTGKIGRVICRILQGFGMKVLAYDKFPDREYAGKEKIEYTSLDNLYKNADVISLHCPLTRESYHLINRESISMMKNGVMLINTSRGQLIDTPALVEGLKTGKIGSAGLDVYEEENEYFFEDFSNSHIDDDVLARLLSFNNVLVTSHQGFFTREALHNIAATTLTNISQFIKGEALENEICYKCSLDSCRKKKQGRCW